MLITYSSAYSHPAPGQHQGFLCCQGVVLPFDSEALGVGYFFLATLDFSPTPQSSIYFDLLLEALGVGYFF